MCYSCISNSLLINDEAFFQFLIQGSFLSKHTVDPTRLGID